MGPIIRTAHVERWEPQYIVPVNPAIHLGPNKGQTWCEITIYERGLSSFNMPKCMELRDMYIAQKL